MTNKPNEIVSLYLKNFKGFSEACLQLADVNFLVGENSTGKTALLKLINVLSSQEFWFYSEFNTQNVELGYFDEILSKNSTEGAFYIGLERTISNEGATKKIVFEIKGRDNIPYISRVKATHDGLDIYINLSIQSVSYSFKKGTNKLLKEWANDWVNNQSSKRMNAGAGKLPLSLLMNLIEDEISNIRLKKDKKEVGSSRKGSFKTYPLFQNYLWIAPIRAKAKRIYESYNIQYSPEGEHIPFLLRKLIAKAKKNKNDKLLKYLEDFGKESKLFDKINIKELGGKNSAPFEINVSYNNLEIKLTNVGYGVSQALPLVIEILSSTNQEFSIQQPEVHLHPKAQAAFGSLIFNSFILNKNKFVIETHSDFTINRFRHELYKANKSKDKPSAQILFFERNRNTTKFSIIPIGKDGEYETSVPPAYRDFFIDEELKLLEL
nr:AAA family ATPase [uncultured Pedobacter sp.]